MISYIGGKSTISTSLIIPNIPKDIETYVEPFSGMYWVLFKMNIEEYPNLNRIVYNDFNPLNVNLFKCIKCHEKLLESCNKVIVQQKGDTQTSPECRETFNRIQSKIFDSKFIVPIEPDYELAAEYALVLTNVFSGSNPSKAKFIDLKGKYHSKFTSFKNKLSNPKWQKLFESITDVENMDFQDVIEKYDSPTTYFYCDPPYFMTEKYYANHEFGIETHERLANTLKSVEGKFSLSYYDFKQLSEWFPKHEYVWKSKDFNKSAAAKSGLTQTKGTELLIMNYKMDID